MLDHFKFSQVVRDQGHAEVHHAFAGDGAAQSVAASLRQIYPDLEFWADVTRREEIADL